MSAAREAELLTVRASIQTLNTEIALLQQSAVGPGPDAQYAREELLLMRTEVVELRKQETVLLNPPVHETLRNFQDQLHAISDQLGTGSTEANVQTQLRQLTSQLCQIGGLVMEQGGGLPHWWTGVQRAFLAAVLVVLAVAADGYHSHRLPVGAIVAASLRLSPHLLAALAGLVPEGSQRAQDWVKSWYQTLKATFP